jgi:hypothetical protein
LYSLDYGIYFCAKQLKKCGLTLLNRSRGANWDHRKSRVGDQKFLGDEWVREEKDGRGAKKELE